MRSNHHPLISHVPHSISPSVRKQVSFSRKATTSKDSSASNHNDEEIFHRRIVHFEKGNGGEEEDNRKKSNKKPYGGFNHRQFAKAVDP